MKRLLTAAIVSFGFAVSPAYSADPVQHPPAAMPDSGDGIWAAIAYSPSDGKHGFFWGAARRGEAMTEALHHCEDAGGRTCEVAQIYRAPRNDWWGREAGPGYQPCGALAVGSPGRGPQTAWGSATAVHRRDAEEKALASCQAGGDTCRIREWVCT